MDLKFGIFGGFRWIRSSALVDEPGFGRVSKFRFSGLNPVFGPFLAVQCSMFGLFGGV